MCCTAQAVVVRPSLPYRGPFHPRQQRVWTYERIQAWAGFRWAGTLRISYWSGTKNAMVMVMLSPNCATVPLWPVNFAWARRIGSTHGAFAAGAVAPASTANRRVLRSRMASSSRAVHNGPTTGMIAEQRMVWQGAVPRIERIELSEAKVACAFDGDAPA